MEKRLRVFAKWLSEYSEDCYDSTREGVVESAVRYAQDSTMNKIGDMLLEVLNFTDEQIKNEL
tara:strand:+ start:409 stop:597 length:189 start_codon:yes stop_codon:yes gene_type:complete